MINILAESNSLETPENKALSKEESKAESHKAELPIPVIRLRKSYWCEFEFLQRNLECEVHRGTLLVNDQINKTMEIVVKSAAYCFQDCVDAIKAELEVHRYLVQQKVPSIVPLLGVSPEDIKPPYFVTEFMWGRSLADFLEQYRFTANTGTQVMLDVAMGLNKMHELGIVHRDIKSLNIFLNKDLRAFIGDFGTSRFYNSKIGYKIQGLDEVRYTPGWADPVMLNTPENNYIYDDTFDVFSYGVLCWSIITGKDPKDYPPLLPFNGLTYELNENHFYPISLDESQSWPSKIIDLTKECLNLSRLRRPSFFSITKRVAESREELSVLIKNGGRNTKAL